MKLQKHKGEATYWTKLTFLSKEIKATFFISLFFILIIELFLKVIPAPFHFIYVIGYIFLNVCYSVFAASIFFIVVYHLPKEERNIKTNRFLQNKLVAISNELAFLFVDIGVYTYYGPNDENRKTLTQEEIEYALKKIDFEEPFKYDRVHHSKNFNIYMQLKFETMKTALEDLINCNDLIETELLGLVFELEQEFNTLEISFKLYNISFTDPFMNFIMSNSIYAHFIYNVFELNKRIRKITKC